MNLEQEKEELDFQLNSYNYELNSSLIASKPERIRHQSRMMIVKNNLSPDKVTVDKYTLDIVDQINDDDLVVVNDTKVMKARLRVQLENGTLIELLVLELIEKSIWLCLAKSAKKLKLNGTNGRRSRYA